jgi:hypothetical protein
MCGRFGEANIVYPLLEIERDVIANDREVLIIDGERGLRRRSSGCVSGAKNSNREKFSFHGCQVKHSSLIKPKVNSGVRNPATD